MTLFARRVALVVALGTWHSGVSAVAVEMFLDNAGDPIAWPTTGGVITGLDPAAFDQNERSGSAPWTLSQTFQVDSQFDLSSLFFIYRNKLPQGSPMGLQIFAVPDVSAPMLPVTPSPADLLLDSTFDALTSNNERVVAQVVLDSALTLPATTGTAGYALRFIDSDPGEFRWYRTDGTAGDVFAGGQAFEKFDYITSGMRDFGLVLSSVGAPLPPMDAFSVQSGGFESGTTWDTGQPPAPGFVYNVVAPHTVAVNSTSFDGVGVVVQNGGTLDLATSFADLKSVDLQAGGSLTTSMTGDIGIGDINAAQLMKLHLGADVSIAPAAGRDVFIDAVLSGPGDINVQSSGPGSDLFLSAAGGHQGVVRFNGSGDEVAIVEVQGFNVLEMNSTGANRVYYEPQSQTSSEAIIFNQPGEVFHAAVNNRRQEVARLEVNANVAVDLSTAATSNELRWKIGEVLTGLGDVSVIGTVAAPALEGVTENEFEVGGSDEPSVLAVNDYSGTLSGSGYVDLEIHNSLPNAKVVAGANATIEVGHRAVQAAHSIALGEVEVASGGMLVVGFAEDGFHHAHTLQLTSSGSRGGDLTMAASATLVMQINGTADGQFDAIVAEGDVSLAGQLELLVNPTASGGTNPVYAPTLGDTFDLISIGPSAIDGDFTGDGFVDGADFLLWQRQFGGAGPEADGNGDGSVDAADLNEWAGNYGEQGTITGALSGSLLLNVVDPGGVMAAAGLAFDLSATATALRLEVVSASVSALAVPEPSAAAICVAAFASFPGLLRRSRRHL